MGNEYYGQVGNRTKKEIFEVFLVFLTAVFLILLPLFIVSSVLAFFLLREMNRQEKKNAKKGVYSGMPLIQTPMGQKKVSILVRCPNFRG